MIRLSVKFDTSGFERKLAALKKDQVPFAAAKALTQTAHAVNDAIKAEMSARFKGGATPYSLRAFSVYRATKQKLVSKVWLRIDGPSKGTIWSKALGHLFTGGTREYKRMEGAFRRIGVLYDGDMMVPGSGCPLDGYGNPPRALIVQLISYFQAFSEVGYLANMSDKRKAKLASFSRSGAGPKTINGVVYFISRGPGVWYGKRQYLPAGIWAKTGTHGAKVRPIFLFVKAGTWRRTIDIDSIASRVTDNEFPSRFRAALKDAIATAR